MSNQIVERVADEYTYFLIRCKRILANYPENGEDGPIRLAAPVVVSSSYSSGNATKSMPSILSVNVIRRFGTAKVYRFELIVST
jgi:hypothetical protein